MDRGRSPSPVGASARLIPEILTRRVAALSATEHRFVADAARALPGPAWLSERRVAAYERFAGADLPTDAEEVWRYSRIGELDLGRYEPPDGRDRPAEEDALPDVARALLASVGERSGLVVTTAGRVTRVEGSAELDAAGARIGGFGHLEGLVPVEEMLGSVASPTDALADLATAFLVDAAVVSVPGGAQVTAPVVVLHVVPEGGQPSAVFPRTIVSVGRGGSAAVVELLVSGSGDTYVGPVAELDVGEGAALAFHSMQWLGRRGFGVAHQASRIGRDARFVSFTASLGGHYARCRTDSRLTGQGGSSKLMAAFFGDGDQMHDFRTLQEHAAPRTSSDLLFKGAVADTAQSVYSGLIRIRHGARGSDAFQTNRNLVLSEGAHADSVPNLDIEENDVKCSHASTVGPIDADQRYYLESRGVPRAIAERLIIVGFFDDLFERVRVTGLRPLLRNEIATRLAAAGIAGDTVPVGAGRGGAP